MATRIYHITHVDNLASILRSGGLVSTSRRLREAIQHTDIAHSHIQDRRSKVQVPCSAGGVLHDYVPFYFAPRSPMLYSNHKQNVAGYQGGQTPILHLVTTPEAVQAAKLPCCFTDGHAAINYAEFYDDLSLLGTTIDWKLMEAKYWSDTEDDPNRQFRRNAEFLVHDFVPWGLMIGIAVIDEAMKRQVDQVLQSFSYKAPVKVYPKYYY
jgi:ssDNA thymidine ADP-ribosyltransferase, DarT